MTCPFCCEEFDIDAAREEFNAACHSPYIDGYDEFWYDQKPACGPCSITQFKLMRKRNHSKVYDGPVPVGCAACGGDYPSCRQGCDLVE